MTLDNWVNTAVAVSTILMVCKMFLEWISAEARKRKYMLISGGFLAVISIKDIIMDFSSMTCFLEAFLTMVAMMLLLKLYSYLQTDEDVKVCIGIGIFLLVCYVAICLFC